MYIQKFTLILSLTIAGHAMLSCNSETRESAPTANQIDTTAKKKEPKTPDVTTMQPVMTCYAGNMGKDSFSLRVEKFPTVVTGSLSFDFFEKDQSTGDLDGKLMGDTLLANYTYQSEGTISSRQVIFLIRDGIATEGYADMKEQDGKMIFKDLRTVKFSGPKLMSTACSTP